MDHRGPRFRRLRSWPLVSGSRQSPRVRAQFAHTDWRRRVRRACLRWASMRS